MPRNVGATLPIELIPEIEFLPKFVQAIVSIDVGVRNMGVVRFVPQEQPIGWYITDLQVVDLVASASTTPSIYELLYQLYMKARRSMYLEPGGNVQVLIEQQPMQAASKGSINNAKTAAISHALYMYCIGNGIAFDTISPKMKDKITVYINRAIQFDAGDCPSVDELRAVEISKKRTYSQRKGDSVKFVTFLIEHGREHFSDSAVEAFYSLSKKDDVSDAIMQFLAKYASSEFRSIVMDVPKPKPQPKKRRKIKVKDEQKETL